MEWNSKRATYLSIKRARYFHSHRQENYHSKRTQLLLKKGNLFTGITHWQGQAPYCSIRISYRYMLYSRWKKYLLVIQKGLSTLQLRHVNTNRATYLSFKKGKLLTTQHNSAYSKNGKLLTTEHNSAYHSKRESYSPLNITLLIIHQLFISQKGNYLWLHEKDHNFHDMIAKNMKCLIKLLYE